MNGNGSGFGRSLTGEQIYALFNDPFHDPASPITLRPPRDVSILLDCPFLCIVELLLQAVAKEGGLKLTQRGYLPPKLCREIYARRHITDWFIDEGITKITTEGNLISVHTARLIIGIAGLVKKQKNTLSLTRKGQALLGPEKRFELFRAVFYTYTVHFNWAYNDMFTDLPVGQSGFAFTLMLLKGYGSEWREARFYADIFRTTVSPADDLFEEEEDPEEKKEKFIRCYCLRSFERFTNWFGLTEFSRKEAINYAYQNSIRKTPLFDAVIGERKKSG